MLWHKDLAGNTIGNRPATCYWIHQKESSTGVPNPKALKILDQVAHSDTESLGNPHQGMDTGRFLSPLKLANINRMQVGLLGQSLLAQTRALPAPANRLANNFLMSQRTGHALLGKQEAAP
jgi:hypothetical protein